MAVIQAKINEAQNNFNEECERLDRNVVEVKKSLELKAEQDKENYATQLVENIIGKIL